MVPEKQKQVNCNQADKSVFFLSLYANSKVKQQWEAESKVAIIEVHSPIKVGDLLADKIVLLWVLCDILNKKQTGVVTQKEVSCLCLTLHAMQFKGHSYPPYFDLMGNCKQQIHLIWAKYSLVAYNQKRI